MNIRVWQTVAVQTASDDCLEERGYVEKHLCRPTEVQCQHRTSLSWYKHSGSFESVLLFMFLLGFKSSLVTNKACTESADEITTAHICQAAVSLLLHGNMSPFRWDFVKKKRNVSTLERLRNTWLWKATASLFCHNLVWMANILWKFVVIQLKFPTLTTPRSHQSWTDE